MLFQDDLNPAAHPDRTDEFLQARLADETLVDFARSLILGVRRNRDELDVLLTRNATNWSLARMAATDRNVLRLGAFEIIYTETPDRVAINEAVELAKRYGSANSALFVNGVLDSLLERQR